MLYDFAADPESELAIEIGDSRYDIDKVLGHISCNNKELEAQAASILLLILSKSAGGQMVAESMDTFEQRRFANQLALKLKLTEKEITANDFSRLFFDSRDEYAVQLGYDTWTQMSYKRNENKPDGL